MLRWMGIALAAVLLTADSGLAQTSSGHGQFEATRNDAGGAVRRTIDAAQEAELFRPLAPGERVSYADVLAAPDDVSLAFRWALTQMGDGNLPGAAGTLERILLIQPELERVRLFYAIVLYRLGNLEDADREFAKLSEKAPQAVSRREIASYRTRIENARRRTRYFASFTAGTQHDTNRNSAPISDQVKIGDVRFALTSSNDAASDGSFFSLGEVGFEHELPGQEDETLVGAFGYFQSEQSELSDFHVQAAQLRLGRRTRRERTVVDARLVSNLVDLARHPYLRDVGVELDIERPIAPRLSLRGGASLHLEDYDGISQSPSADERSGFRTKLDATLAWTLGARQRVSFDAGLEHKSAEQGYHAFDGWDASVSHLWILEGGEFLLTEAELEFEKYRDRQDLVSQTRRRDFRSQLRATFGIPLARVFGQDSALSGVTLSLSGDVLFATSNLPNYDYRNRRVGVSLSRRLEF